MLKISLAMSLLFNHVLKEGAGWVLNVTDHTHAVVSGMLLEDGSRGRTTEFTYCAHSTQLSIWSGQRSSSRPCEDGEHVPLLLLL